MEAKAKPSIIQEIDEQERAFLESIGAEMPEGEELSAVDARLDYLLEKIADRKRDKVHAEEVAERRISMIESWLESETAKAEREIEWLERQVRLSFPQTPDQLREERGTKKKSVSLPNGTIGFRSSRDTVDVVDEEKALRWAEGSCPDAIKVKRRVLKTPIKKMLAEGGVLTTGEPCDPEENGLRFVPGSDSFYVKVGG